MACNFTYAVSFALVILFGAADSRADESLESEQKKQQQQPPVEKSASAPLSAAATPSNLQQEIYSEYYSNKLKQRWGHILLGSGMGVTVAGVALIEIDSWGDIGKAGFISVGSGLGISIVGMFILGFSRPIHELQPSRRISAFPTLDNRGAGVVYEIYF